MNYRMAVLTHGGNGTPAEAIDSFLMKLTHWPTDILIYGDGPEAGGPVQRAYRLATDHELPALTYVGDKQVGFCDATAILWNLASQTPRASDPLKLPDHVLWVEHDFRLRRMLDPQPLAAVLAHHALYGDAQVCQMSLMRNAVNDIEKAAGGLYESRPGHYQDEGRWLSHRAYFTTNPAMMTVEFMLREHFPGDGGRACEGRFSIDLFERGYRAGVWGDGSPWVEHVGHRNGFGY
jgi:hypothetical protein